LDKAPVSFVIIKATEGMTLVDDKFDYNFREARENGLIRGAYHFFVPGTDAKEQAHFFIRNVTLESGDLPPVLDVEKIGKLSKETLATDVKTWLDIVEQHYGVKPILYTGYNFKLKYLDAEMFDVYPYWIAHYYVEALKYSEPWHFWQHTDRGEVLGIQGRVDCNVFNGSLEDLSLLLLR
jgi:lysozyme